MCTAGDGVPGSVGEALAVMDSCLDYLLGPARDQVPEAALGGVLESLAAVGSRFAAARTAYLARFDAGSCHDADGYGSSAAWLAGKTGTSPKAARAQVKAMRQLAAHPALAAAVAAGRLPESWAAAIADWTKKFPADMRPETDEILLAAAAGGADLDDLKMLATAAWQQWKGQQPDPDDPGDGFDDRFVQLDTTFDGAGRLAGNLSPECAAAVQAVLEALGKKRGPEDDRSAAARFHDALQEGCELLIRARMVPDRAGADTHVDVHVSLADLRAMPGAAVLEDAWLRARAGQHGYLAGKDAEAIACDALIVPVVTGAADWAVIGQMIELVLDAVHGQPAAAKPAAAGQPAAGQPAAGQPAAAPLPPQARESLRHALAKLAIDFMSGPGGLASVLRTGLLEAPYNSRSVPLDVGYSQSIPEPIRRAVILRDKKCAWPGGCDARPARCDVHHVRHKKDGGPTSVRDCILLCQYHHDICIHRWGWEIELLPDGSVIARGPRGQILRSHGPPPAHAA